ncbi:MAG TPA: type II secretion system protein GspL [Burkholderiales bacterium]|nr:type II secretion system protein GspL [Burkholderiales bacterium]
MSTLRARWASLNEPLSLEWVAFDRGNPVAAGGGADELPRGVRRAELVVAAADVLLVRTQLPQSARARTPAALAYAAEEQTVADAESQRVTWLGRRDGADALAIVDRALLDRAVATLRASAIAQCDVYCETLLLPRAEGEWSVAWDGAEGFVRSGELEGFAMDEGDAMTPPLSLTLALVETRARPRCIAVYGTDDAAPDVDAWSRELGVEVRLRGPWDWRDAELARVARIASESRSFALAFTRFRTAAAFAGAALALHAVAVTIDWARLAREESALERSMEARFRAVFPEAVAVVDPALQMRRKLAEARHAANQSDAADFLPVATRVAEAMKALPAGTLREAAYDSGRLRLRLAPMADGALQSLVGRLREAGLSVDLDARSADAPVVVTVSGA